MGGRRTLASDRDAFSGARGRSEAFARESHPRMEQFLAHATDSRLSESVTFSWFKDPPLTITVTEAGRDRFLPAIGHKQPICGHGFLSVSKRARISGERWP